MDTKSESIELLENLTQSPNGRLIVLSSLLLQDAEQRGKTREVHFSGGEVSL